MLDGDIAHTFGAILREDCEVDEQSSPSTAWC